MLVKAALHFQSGHWASLWLLGKRIRNKTLIWACCLYNLAGGYISTLVRVSSFYVIRFCQIVLQVFLRSNINILKLFYRKTEHSIPLFWRLTAKRKAYRLRSIMGPFLKLKHVFKEVFNSRSLVYHVSHIWFVLGVFCPRCNKYSWKEGYVHPHGHYCWNIKIYVKEDVTIWI